MGYSPQSDLSGEQWLMLVLALTLTLGLWLTTTSAPAQTAPADTVAQVKADFDQAMAKPLAERIPDLEALEQRIASDLFEGKLAGEQTIGGLRYLYHTRMKLAKHDEAYGTYCDYLHAIENQATPAESYATYLRDLDAWVLQKDYPHLEGLCTRVREVLADHSAIAEAALYHQAYANYRMNGTLQRCIELCSALISEHPDSVWRPKAYRVLANAQLGTGGVRRVARAFEVRYQGREPRTDQSRSGYLQRQRRLVMHATTITPINQRAVLENANGPGGQLDLLLDRDRLRRSDASLREL